MKPVSTGFLLCLTTLSLTSAQAPVSHDAAVIIRYAGGAAVEGRIVRDTRESIRLATVLGHRVIPRLAVRETVPASEARQNYERRARTLNRRDPAARAMLAGWCEEQGLTSAMLHEIGLVFAVDPLNREAWQIVRRLAATFEMVDNQYPADKPRFAREQVELLYAAAEKADIAKAAFLRTQLEAIDRKLSLEQSLDMMRARGPMQRWIACHMLGDTTDVRRVKPLYIHAVADPYWHVRHAAVDALRRSGDGDVTGPIVKQLLTNMNNTVVLFAAEALAQLGDQRAILPLIRALADSNSARPTRNNLTVLTQKAYVKDFDVEIAQGAVIADPIVEVIREGVVHDVAVVSIAAMRTGIVGALTALSGQNHGADHGAWAAWFESERAASTPPR